MDLRAPGVRVARFPQTPRKVYSSTCQSRTPPPPCKLWSSHTPARTIPGTLTCPYICTCTPFLRMCLHLEPPASVSNTLGFLKVRASGSPRAAKNRAELAIPQTLLPGARRVRHGKLPE